MTDLSRNKRFLLIVVFLVINGVNSAIDDETKQSIDEFINTVVGCRDITGMNIAIVHGGETVYTQGYGITNRESPNDVTADTFFGIASLSKAFTTTLLGKLLHQNNLTWDTPIRDVLGENFYFKDGLRSTRATLRDLGSHTLGIPSNNYVRMQEPTREELAQKIRFLEPTADFRTSYKYNNLMYGLLSYISEVIGGGTWEELMTSELFRPMGMNLTSFTHVADMRREDIATPYLVEYDDGEWREVSAKLHSEWGELGGSGSILTSANQMAEWLHFQLNKGLSQSGVRVADESVVEETHHPVNGRVSTPDYMQRPNIPVTYEFSKYALGWRTGFYRGLPLVMHTGTSWGFGAMLSLLPDVGLGIHTSVTGPDDNYLGRRAVHMYVADVILREGPFLNVTTACTFPAPWTEPPVYRNKYNISYETGHAATLPLDRYEGTFGNYGYGNITVTHNTTLDLLQMRLGHLGLWNLHPYGDENHFAADGIEDIWPIDVWAEFSSKNQDGCPECMDLLSVVNFDSFPHVFERDLNMADAPPPPSTECDEIEGSDISRAASVLKNHMFYFVIISCFLSKIV